MYCTHCGFKNIDQAKFCESCGMQLQELVSSPDVISPSKTRSHIIRRIASIGSLFVVFFFFMPWVLVSCSVGTTNLIEASGYNIASGKFPLLEDIDQFSGYYDAPSVTELTEPNPSLFIILLLGVIGMISFTGTRPGAAISVLVGVLGMTAMAVFTILAQQLGSELMTGFMKLQYRTGYWAEWIGFLWLTIFGYFGFKLKD